MFSKMRRQQSRTNLSGLEALYEPPTDTCLLMYVRSLSTPYSGASSSLQSILVELLNCEVVFLVLMLRQ